MKFGYNWPIAYKGEVVLKLWTTEDDGRRSLPIL